MTWPNNFNCHSIYFISSAPLLLAQSTKFVEAIWFQLKFNAFCIRHQPRPHFNGWLGRPKNGFTKSFLGDFYIQKPSMNCSFCVMYNMLKSLALMMMMMLSTMMITMINACLRFKFIKFISTDSWQNKSPPQNGSGKQIAGQKCDKVWSKIKYGNTKTWIRSVHSMMKWLIVVGIPYMFATMQMKRSEKHLNYAEFLLNF